MLLVKQGLARLVPGWVTQGSCSGAEVGLIRALSDFKAFLYILFGGFWLKQPIKIYKKALKSEKAQIKVGWVQVYYRNLCRLLR